MRILILAALAVSLVFGISVIRVSKDDDVTPTFRIAADVKPVI